MYIYIMQILISPGHYRESLVLRNLRVELVGAGSMQHLLLEGDGHSTVITQVMCVCVCIVYVLYQYMF